LDEYKHLIFSLIADDDTLFLVAQSELAAIELQGQIVILMCLCYNFFD